MAFWIKKKETNQSFTQGQTLPTETAPKTAINKRLDSIRLQKNCVISLRSIGSPFEFVFMTHNISSSGFFIVCQDFAQLPFHALSTLIEGVLEMDEERKIHFIAKIARIVTSQESGTAGFGLRIVHMNMQHKEMLEEDILRLAPSPATEAA